MKKLCLMVCQCSFLWLCSSTGRFVFIYVALLFVYFGLSAFAYVVVCRPTSLFVCVIISVYDCVH